MRSLLDVNVLIALLDSKHDFHEKAHLWHQQPENAEWASCPLTQNAVLRIMSQPGYDVRGISIDVVFGLLRDLTDSPQHIFWPDDISLLDGRRFDLGFALGHRQLTDIYLLGLAFNNGARLVSFDSRISISSVLGARPENLVLI